MNPSATTRAVGRRARRVGTTTGTSADASSPDLHFAERERSSAAGSVPDQLAERLAGEMRRRWADGEQPAAEEFLSRHPELWDAPQAAVELVYEEYCLREAAGQADAADEIVRRFPQWAGPLRVMLDCHRRVLLPARDGPRFAIAGEQLGDFTLVAELARGARGRVFLATETALADRPVVLKVTPLDGGGEHLSLARLQHTNIVPVYSVFQDAERRVHVLCMPYFGRTTLATVLEALAAVPLARRTGADLLAAIDRAQDVPGLTTSAAPVASAARQMLAHVSYVQALCWVTAGLADALHFAHERGVVHLDLKPSNVLLASDGQPMLLDFHLARAPVGPGGPPPDSLGGTPPYMPPEQRAAIRSLQDGKPVETTVDARADVYALAAVLYEALGGQLTTTSAGDLRGLADLDRHVSVGLSDVIARCLAPRPADRYPDAQSLADDLRRHLTDQPLVGVRDRSAAERWHKWRRRRPGALRRAGTLALVACAAIVLASASWSRLRDRRDRVEIALVDGERQLSAGQYAEATRTLERGAALAAGLPFHRELRRQATDRLTAARQLHLTDELHQVAEAVRELYVAADDDSADRLRPLGAQCEALWRRRDGILAILDPSNRDEAARELQDVAIFAAHARARPSSGAGGAVEAIRLVDEAEAAFGPSAALAHERGRHRERTAAPPELGGIAAPAPRNAWEHAMLGRALLASGHLPAARRELEATLRLDPAGRWPNFYLGVCAYRSGRFEDAVAAFSVCIGAAPQSAACFYNRAIAHTAMGHIGEARRDAGRVLELDPTHTGARALVARIGE